MKLIIDIPKECMPAKQDVLNVPLHFIDGQVCEAGGYGFMNISDNATNGDVIKAITNFIGVQDEEDTIKISTNWWNSPYQKGDIPKCENCKHHTDADEIHGYTPCGNCGIDRKNYEQKGGKE